MVKKKKKASSRWLLVIIGIVLIGGLCGLAVGYKMILAPNIDLKGKESDIFTIPTGASYENVLQDLNKNGWLKNETSFDWLADIKKYKQKVKPGRYRLRDGMSNNALVNLLRSGAQEPVKLVLFGIRKKEELAGRIAKKLESDSTAILEALNDPALLQSIGLSPNNALTLFIPNTYEVFWNTTPEDFIRRMAKEYKKFWTADRKGKAVQLGLSQTEVSVLASIVQSETNQPDDKPIVAGVYLNRLKRNMPLEADPTLVWALNDFTIKRVLNVHKSVESPYNTYKYAGLPPGPISLPTIESLDAVLNAQSHKYIYFCAKEDFSGFSNFAETLSDHMANARKYQRELSRKGIYH